ncbi:MAG: cytochrome-c peroxidase [Maioricimonas sp. JB049]
MAAAGAASDATAAAESPEPLPIAVTLGDPSLTSGIPGEGPLSAEQIAAWLETPGIHEPLDVSLPLGLRAAQAQIVGLKENPMTRAKIELGRQLYFDPRLSSDSTISCASCHDPEQGYAAYTKFGVGVEGQLGNRNSPTIYNRILSGPQFWDGRAASLEEQAHGPIDNPIEMANTHEQCVATVSSIPGYAMQFDAIFGENSCDITNITNAIATFERAIVTGPSPYDYHVRLKRFTDRFPDDEAIEEFREEEPELYEEYLQAKADAELHPMSESAIRGMELFFSKETNCTACHAGANFTDEKFHNLGVGMDVEEPDLGRYAVTGDEKDKGAFKTPTLRNVELTPPYMHDGSQQTLEEVVEWYAKGGHPNEWLSKDIKKLDLSAQDKEDLVAFMKALTGPFPEVEIGRLPEVAE